MPILISDPETGERRALELPRELPLARETCGVPGGECFGCYLGDCDPDLHDIPDACEYLGGLVFDLGDC